MPLFNSNLKLTQNPPEEDEGSFGGNILNAIGGGLGGGGLFGGLLGGGVLPNVLKVFGRQMGGKEDDDNLY